MTKKLDILNIKLFIATDYLVVLNKRNQLLIDTNKNVYRTINKDLGKLLEWIADGKTIIEFIKKEKILNTDSVVRVIDRMIEIGIVQTNSVDYGIGNPIRKTDDTYPLERLFISLTENCNLRCKYCYVYINDQINNQLDFLQLKKVFDSAIAQGVWKVDLIGGEIFCRNDVYQILQYLTDKKVVINIFTNATLINKSNIDKLSTFSIEKYNISFDNIDRELFEKNRGVSGIYSKLMGALSLLKSRNKQMSFNVPYIQNEKESIIETINFLHKNYSNDIVIYPICPMGRSKNKQFVLDSDYYYVKKYALKKCNFNKEYNTANSDLVTSCGIAEQFLFIESDGNICLCPTLSSKYDKDLYIGNILEENIEDIWHNNSVINSFRSVTCKKSSICENYSKCKGGCRSNAYYQNKEIEDIDRKVCYLFEERIFNL